jgi:hypothetical protein
MNVERDSEHRYWIVECGQRIQAIGVTRTLVESGLVDDSYFSDKARGRGRLAHFFAERIATNTLSFSPVDTSIVGFMIGLRRFLDRYTPTVINAEVLLANAPKLLAGTADLDVYMLGALGVIEIKTGTPTPWHGLQLAPYAYMLDGSKWLDRVRWGLYLTERGGFRLKEYDDPTDLDYFLRAHELLHWRIKHGSHERPYGRRARSEPDTFVDDNSGDWRDSLDGDSREG